MPIGLDFVTVRNWRVLDEVSFAPDPGVSWIMGPNGSGKSSVLDGLSFACELLRSAQDPRRVLRQDARGEPISNGTWEFRDLLRDPNREASWDLTFTDAAEVTWRYQLALRMQGAGFAIVNEQLERKGEDGWTSLLEHDGNGGRVVRKRGEGLEWVPMAYRPMQPLLARASDPFEHAALVPALRFLEGIWLVHPDPLLMRGRTVAYDPEEPVDRYGRDLEGLVEATIAAYPSEFSRVIDALQQATGWRKIRSIPRAQERRVVFDEADDGRPLLLDLASDGQLVALWLACLSTFPPERWTVALVDEPAVALGHGPQGQVFAWLRGLSRDVQVITATHDDRAVDLDSRESVWRLAREPGAAPKLVRLDEDPEARRWPGVFKPGDVAVRLAAGVEE